MKDKNIKRDSLVLGNIKETDIGQRHIKDQCQKD